MAEIKGIDVSSYQGKIDWKSVASYGMGFAILRITEKGNIVDSTFEANYKGCIENKIPVGVYKYSYATTLTQIKEEANIVVKTLNKRTLNYPVFLDIEDKCQENLPSYLMMQMIDVFKEIIVQAGYKFGIYCGKNWYETKLPEAAKKYDCWLASYPSNDNGTLQEKLRPSVGIGWQYSSKATIPGIPTKVDRNVFYKDYSDENTSDKEEKTLSVYDVISSAISTAKKELGYLEKKSNAQLDDKTANAGYNNYTKYWRDIKPDYQGQPWCACFVSWVFKKVFGLETAKKLLKHWPYVYCPTLGSLFTKYANPKVGDIVIFYRNGEFAHTGIVISVNGDYFETIEGNASSASGITPNGGAVVQKGYYNSKLPGTKFCRPDYSIATNINTSTNTSSKPSIPATSTGNQLVKNAQTHLNNFVGCNIKIDGILGQETMQTFRKAVQVALNKDLGYNLKIDGIIGSNSKTALKKVALKTGSKGYLVTVVEIGMLLNNIDPKGVECPGSFWSGLESGVKCFQAKKGLSQDGIVGYNTLMALCA